MYIMAYPFWLKPCWLKCKSLRATLANYQP